MLTMIISPISRMKPTACTASSTRALTGRREMTSQPRKTSRPPSRAGMGSRLKRPRCTEMIAIKISKGMIP